MSGPMDWTIGMWGDATYSVTGGEDTFVFLDNFANDFVHDFRQGEDLIEFDANGFGSFAELVFDDIDVEGIASTKITSNNAAITGSVTLVGYDNEENPLGPEGFTFPTYDDFFV